ncbi:oligosaccharide flippase family protein [Streptomyces sp. NPDC047072]|uniref:oligosaccharide flippase family protein n=1 Tax=Streptomyces sp. NPDC047072 TaxID=3154809 RepID=UPI0034045E2F
MPSHEAGQGGEEPQEQADLTRAELKDRATAGVLIVVTRGLLIMLLALAGNIVVARLLAPRDFGVVAIGMTFVLFAGLISQGGLGVGLIRRAEPPSAAELGTLTTLQAAVTGAFVVVAVAVAPTFGRVGWVTAVMMTSMPFAAVQLPGRILLERALLFRRLVVVEVSEVVFYQAWAVGTVAAGFGVWGLATATVVRALAGGTTMAWACPEGLVRPRCSFLLVRPLLGFGLRFQAVDATLLVRIQALNGSIAAISGLSTLGLWVLAGRLMQVPDLVFQALWRVSFPTMSRLVAQKEDVVCLVERALRIAAVGTGLVLTGLTGAAAGLVPGVFGEQWKEASTIIPGACLALAIGGCVSVATQGYLYAIGDATAVLRAALVQAGLWFAVALPLLPLIGPVSIGIGWGVSAVAEAVVLGRAATRRLRVSLIRPLLVPVATGVCSASVGWMIAEREGADLRSGTLGGACAVALFVVCMAVLDRPALRETWRFAVASMRAASRRQHRG